MGNYNTESIAEVKEKKERNRSEREEIRSQLQQINEEKDRLNMIKMDQLRNYNTTISRGNMMSSGGPIKILRENSTTLNFYNNYHTDNLNHNYEPA